MLFGIIDRVCFAALFITLLQIPIIADHYRQYLSGFVDASRAEIDHYQNLATTNGFASTAELLASLAQNTDPLIREDTAHKVTVVANYQEAMITLETLQHSHFFSQAWLFAQPHQYPRLVRVLQNYRPSLPLQLPAIGSALLCTLVFYGILALCVKLLRRRSTTRATAY